MKKLAFFDTKPYDTVEFDKLSGKYNCKIKYFETRLNPDTAALAKGCDAVIAFVNDEICKETIDTLYDLGIRLIALRCAGFNNVDRRAAAGKITIVRVPAYSPSAVAEHSIGMLLTLVRRIHKAYLRTRDFNFTLNGLTGLDLFGKTAGVIGTGKIGQCFINICKGFGMRVLAYDPYPAENCDIEYTSLENLISSSDIISLHCPLTKENTHLINKESISKMKNGAYIINTSRGGLIDAEELLEALKTHKLGGACLDVYEEESELFFEDHSEQIIQDDILARLISLPNVIVTSHQAFLTHGALENIAETTMENIKAFFEGAELVNEVKTH